jgi:V/A-type H+-transporting ATPase subunit I
MISDMKKYTFLVYHKEYRKFLTQLGNIGVLHVIERDELKEDELLIEKNSLIDLYSNALKSINTAEEKNPSIDQSDKQNERTTPEQLLARVEE